MTRPPQRENELFVSERPVRSDYARDYGREKIYARRRKITLAVLALIIGGSGYVAWKHHARNPADIPTIKAESGYKQKPADPGGIDIPHQDVRVYDQLEGKNTPQQQVEHLLPPPETPQDVPHAAAIVAVPPPPPPAQAASPAVSAPTTPLPVAAPKPDVISAPVTPKMVATTVTPVAVSPPPVSAPLVSVQPVSSAPASAPPQTIADVLKDTMTATAPAPTVAPPVVSSGNVAIQLASVSDQGKAQEMMENLQQKYASDLNGAVLRLARADLGSRGIFYRIQSQGLSEDAANHICSALKQKNAGCLLVRK